MSAWTGGEDYLDYQAQIKADTAVRISYELAATANYQYTLMELVADLYSPTLPSVGVNSGTFTFAGQTPVSGTMMIPNFLPGGFTP